MKSSGTSACSQWDSSSLQRFSASRTLRRDGGGHGKAEVLESKGLPQGVDHTTAAKLAGDRNVWCETKTELIAIKLNRSEQHKLKTYSTLVMKEMTICERRYQQNQKLMRRKSAQLKSRIKQIEDEYSADARFGKPVNASAGKLLRRRRFSDSEANTDHVNGSKRCAMCAKIQNIIDLYEKENYPSGKDENALEHSTCLFSDVQMKSFIRLLDAEHFQDVPIVASRLNITRSASTLISGSRSSSNIVKHPVERHVDVNAIDKRVKDFCLGLETFNKATNCIPDSVKVSLEKTRHEDAVLLRAPPPKPLSLRKDVELLFNPQKPSGLSHPYQWVSPL